MTTISREQVITIADSLRLLHAPGEVFEIRIPEATISSTFSRTVYGYFDDPDKAAAAIMPYVGRDNIYQTIQPINPALLARAYNHLKQSKKKDSQTADKDVIGYRWLLADTDPERPSGISASEDELKAALDRAKVINDYLIGEWGWPESIRAISGNGGHLLFRTNLPNEQETIDLVQRFLEHIANRFGDDRVKVDRTVYNPSRIWKVYGTAAAKGDSTPNRPHRIARVTYSPETLGVVSVEMLKAVAPPITKTISTSEVSTNGKGYTAKEIRNALDKQNVEYSEKTKDGRLIFDLHKCLTNDAHTDGACITFEAGKPGYKCHHDSCKSKNWQDVKPILFPDRANQPRATDNRYSSQSHNRELGIDSEDECVPIYETVEGEPEPEPDSDCLPLPNSIPYFERQHTDHWLGLYVDYALKVSPMTPPDFHESGGLWLASAAIARRLKVPMPFGEIYPNLFVLWFASTTLHRKTTALDIPRRIARRIMPYLLAVQDSTPEAMLADLAGREPVHFEILPESDQILWKKSRNFAAQKGWVLDEVSSLLANAGKDYNAGLTEALLRLYDCDERFTRSTRSQGLTIVKDSYLSLLGASTPAALSPHLNNKRLWAMGLWPRFTILTPEGRPPWQEAIETDEPQELGNTLTRLLNRLLTPVWPDPPKALTVTLADGVYQTWQQYNKAVSYDLLTDELDERLHGTYGRLPTQVIKVAMILAALDWQEEPAPVIQDYHLAHAIAICEKWRASAHRVLVMVEQNEFNALQKRVIKQLSKNPKGVTLRNLYKAMSDRTPNEIEDALRQLVKAGMIEEVEQPTGPKGGKPTVKYKLL